jgi:hydrogenase-4 component B
MAHIALAAIGVVAAVWLWRKARGSGFQRVLTWDCGYAAPTSRMQYTAGSFAGIITEWFAWILRPVRHEHRATDVFPAQARSTQHTPETVLEYVFAPAGGAIMNLALAARRFQHGRVQAYLLYVLVGTAALAALVLLGGDK